MSVVRDCQSCMEWHITQAAQSGAARREVLEAIEVAIEMAGGPATVSARFALDVMERVFRGAGAPEPAPARSDEWQGRFPKSEIISLLDVNLPLNLAESTSRDLELGELLDLIGRDELSHLPLGYGSSAGTPALREIIGESLGVPADHVLTTQGAALGLFMLAFEICRPGDEVVVVTPCFPPSRDALIGCGVTVREAALSFDDGYRLDPERLAQQLSPRTRLVSLASPQNPSGVCASAAAIRRLLAVMAESAPGALLFIDETYREASYGDAPPRPSVAGLDPRVVTGSSLSKAHGAPGLRVGWLTVADPALRERLRVAKLNIVISGSVLDEALAAGLLHHREAVLAPRRAFLAQGLDILEKWREGEETRIDWVRPDAGALCCLRLRADAFSAAGVERFWRSLPAHDLQLAAGTWFGGSAREFRLGFGYLPIQRLPQALSALTRAMDEAQGDGGSAITEPPTTLHVASRYS